MKNKCILINKRLIQKISVFEQNSELKTLLTSCNLEFSRNLYKIKITLTKHPVFLT